MTALPPPADPPDPGSAPRDAPLPPARPAPAAPGPSPAPGGEPGPDRTTVPTAVPGAGPTARPGAAPALRFGYGTNGLTDLRLDDALALLADLGYDGVGLTLDHMHLDPVGPGLAERTARAARGLARHGLSVTVETGARYVLDPRRKHGPALLDDDPEARRARTGLLLTAVRVGADLGAHAVHCFSGVLPAGVAEETGWRRLAESLTPVVEAAADAGVPLAVEPEPGHLLGDLGGFHRLRRELGDPAPDAVGLTLDLGHCQCLEPLPPADCVREAAPWLRHVQIEDMRRGRHEHLPFGEGEIDFPPVLAALRESGYQGLVGVELPRDSHRGPELARRSRVFLARAEAEAASVAVAGTVPPASGRAPDPAGRIPGREPAPGPARSGTGGR
ncbi:sugar phosphate isomerase/epimerase family protein [Streptomyces zingiberis]|uniref:Sugar phosphate isomerase/epimerase n=1 Tax=Streptomyces zingiberis TaxID=2053010 RepID=A0ABX1C293_9ACTN|nr:sugar phosphate isomerase/epimerase family protein [Streptomyces zingiberis]NJQ03966.1 sugar phosphate isomerase/epimerase [Streptomyces zingiberis]